MGKLKKAIGIGTLAIALSGCGEQQFLEGVVLREEGSITRIVESNGALFGNESVKFRAPTYILLVETSHGNYIMQVYELKKPLEALALAIEIGDKIKFAINSHPNGNHSYFGKDKIGYTYSGEIELLEKRKK